MEASIFHASSLELLYIFSAVLAGTLVATTTISLARFLIRPTQYLYIHSYCIKTQDVQHDQPRTQEQLWLALKRVVRQPLPHVNSVRAHISSLPTREATIEKHALSTGEAEPQMHNLLTLISDQYPRSTYLGFFQSSSNLPCLYARYRLNGITKCLGDVAMVDHSTNKPRLTVRLHPEDAEKVVREGWAVKSQTSPFVGLMNHFHQNPGGRIYMDMPRSRTEIDQVFAPVIRAAVSWATGGQSSESVEQETEYNKWGGCPISSW